MISCQSVRKWLLGVSLFCWYPSKQIQRRGSMAFSGKLVEPTKLDKITLRQAAISFNKGKKNAKIKTKILFWERFVSFF